MSMFMKKEQFKIFTSDMIKKLTGTRFELTRPGLAIWINLGYVKASIPSEGPGRSALFTLHDLYRLGIFTFLVREFGSAAKRHFDCLKFAECG